MHNKYWEQTFLHYLNKGLEHSIIYKMGQGSHSFTSLQQEKLKHNLKKRNVPLPKGPNSFLMISPLIQLTFLF